MGPLEALLAVMLGLTGGLVACLPLRREITTLRRIVGAILGGAVREREIVRARRALARKPRRRYVVFEVIPGGFSEEEVREALEASAGRLLGDLGLALSGISIVEYDKERSRGILRVRREYKALALALLGLTRRVGSSRVLFVPLTTTGSLKRARRVLRPP